MGKINRREEIRKPRRLPSPSSPLAAASRAADESEQRRRREESGERAEGLEGGREKWKGRKEMMYLFII